MRTTPLTLFVLGALVAGAGLVAGQPPCEPSCAVDLADESAQGDSLLPALVPFLAATALLTLQRRTD